MIPNKKINIDHKEDKTIVVLKTNVGFTSIVLSREELATLREDLIPPELRCEQP